MILETLVSHSVWEGFGGIDITFALLSIWLCFECDWCVYKSLLLSWCWVSPLIFIRCILTPIYYCGMCALLEHIQYGIGVAAWVRGWCQFLFSFYYWVLKASLWYITLGMGCHYLFVLCFYYVEIFGYWYLLLAKIFDRRENLNMTINQGQWNVWWRVYCRSLKRQKWDLVFSGMCLEDCSIAIFRQWRARRSDEYLSAQKCYVQNAITTSSFILKTHGWKERAKCISLRG